MCARKSLPILRFCRYSRTRKYCQGHDNLPESARLASARACHHPLERVRNDKRRTSGPPPDHATDLVGRRKPTLSISPRFWPPISSSGRWHRSIRLSLLRIPTTAPTEDNSPSSRQSMTAAPAPASLPATAGFADRGRIAGIDARARREGDIPDSASGFLHARLPGKCRAARKSNQSRCQKQGGAHQYFRNRPTRRPWTFTRSGGKMRVS